LFGTPPLKAQNDKDMLEIWGMTWPPLLPNGYAYGTDALGTN